MLCKDKITAFFCIIDDISKEIEYPEDKHRKISDSEIIATVIISATNFYGNHSSVIKFAKQYELFYNTLRKIRFNRRLHKLADVLYKLFEFIASFFRQCSPKYNPYIFAKLKDKNILFKGFCIVFMLFRKATRLLSPKMN